MALSPISWGLARYIFSYIEIRNQISMGKHYVLLLTLFFSGFNLGVQACKAPQGLSVNVNSATSVSLQWTSGGSNHWQIQYADNSTSLYTAPVININSNPTTLTGLTPNTYYQIHVRDSCGPGIFSNWTSIAYFHTPCQVISAPHTITFDGPSWILPQQSAGVVDPCWYRPIITSSIYWRPGGGGQFSLYSPVNDHTTGSGKYLCIDHNAGSNDTAYVESPLIDLAGIVQPQISFWYHMYGSDIEDFKLYVSSDSGTSYTLVKHLYGQQQSNKNALWKYSSSILDSSFGGKIIRIKLEAVQQGNGLANETSIDDIKIEPAPSCPRPLDLQFISSLGSSAGFQWTSGGATAWQMQYGPTGFSLGNGTIQNISSNPGILTGLSPNTSYDVYVRDSCGPGEVSAWTGPVSFSTLCAEVSAPYHEDFDSSNFDPGPFTYSLGSIDPCWSRNLTGSYIWKAGPNSYVQPNTGPAADHTTGSGGFISTNYMAVSPYIRSTTIESPPIDLSNLTAPHLRFYTHMFGSHIDSLEVQVNKGLGFDTLYTIRGQQQLLQSDPWKERNLPLGSYTSESVIIRLVAYRQLSGGYYCEIAVDDFSVTEAPSCPKPDSLQLDSMSYKSASLSWVSGGATHWQIAYRLLGSTGSYTMVNVGSQPFTLSGLVPSSSYEIKLRDSCGPGDVSTWTLPLSFSTPCGIYSAPFHENFDGPDWIKGGSNYDNRGNKIDSCWTRPGAGNPHFGSWAGPTATVNTGPLADFSGNGKYVFTEVSSASGDGKISTPYIIIPDSIYEPHLCFAYHMYGAGISSLQVKIDSGNGFDPAYLLTGEQQNSSTDPWKVDSINLAAYANDTLRFQFIGSSVNYYGDIALDEVRVTKTCPSVTAAFTDSSAYLQTHFNSNGSLGADSVLWDFGDGKTAITPNPVHQYDTAGTFVVKLIAFNFCGKSDSLRDTLRLCDSLRAHINARVQGDTVYFSADSSRGASGYFWNLDDSLSSTHVNPVAIYDSTGIKNISLIIFNDCGDSLSTSRDIKICPAPVASWTYDTIGKTSNGLVIHFDASASQNASSYHWDFGDGNTGTGPGPTHTYNPAGLYYEVELSVANDCGSLDSKKFHLYEVGVAEHQLKENIQIYPNPTRGAISLKWDPVQLRIEALQLYSSSGEKLQDFTTSESGYLQINMDELPVGYYFIHLTTGQGSINFPVIRE